MRALVFSLIFVAGVAAGAGLSSASASDSSSDYAIRVSKTDSAVVLECIRGCKWLRLESTCKQGKKCASIVTRSGMATDK